MKAMILAAGLGTRLRPLTLTTPKPLIPVGGIPLIFYNLALLKKHGLRDIVINLHYLGDQIERLLGDGKRFGLKISYSHETEILGTGGGIFHARKYLKGSRRFLVINGDIITDLDLTQLIRFHEQARKPVSLALIPNQAGQTPYGELKLDLHGTITSVLGEPGPAEGLSTFFSGIHVIEESVLDQGPSSDKFCIIRDVYIPLMRQGGSLGGFLHQGYWNDLGTKERLAQTEEELKRISLSFQKELKEFSAVLGKK